MTLQVKHAHTAGGVNDPSKEVSKDRWNADHTIVLAEGMSIGRPVGASAATEVPLVDVRDFWLMG